MKAVLSIAVGATLFVAGTAEAQTRHVRHNAASGYAQQAYAHHGGQRGPMVESRVQTYYSDTGWQGGYGPVEAYGYGYGYGGAGQRPPVVVVAPQQPIQHGGYSYGVTRSMPFGYVVDGYGRYPWARGYAYDQGQYQQGQYQQGQYQHGYYQGGYAPAPQPAYYQPAPVYVSQPPVYVSQPPIYVASPPVYVQPAEVRVAPPQVNVAPPQVYVEPPRVETAPPQVNFERGYYAMPDTPPPPPPPPHRSPTERPYMQEPGERG